MKIAIFQRDNYRFSPFSGHLRRSIPEFIKCNCEVHVIYSSKEDVSLTPLGAVSHVFGQWLSFLKFVPKHYLAISQLIFFFNKEKPDVVFAKGLSFGVPVLLARIFSFHKPKIYVSLHSLPTNDIEYKVQRSYIFFSYLAKYVALNADQVFAISKAVKREYEEITGTTKIKILYDPVIASDFSNFRFKVDNADLGFFEINNVKKILAVGRLAPEKDYPTLIKAFNELVADIDAFLYIIGDGFLKEELICLVKNLNLDGRVFFLGRKDDVYSYMKFCDVFVLSSRYEGLSNVIVEALACGAKVVSTNCGGPADILADGIYGDLVPVGDVLKLKEAINKKIHLESCRDASKKRSDVFLASNYVKEIIDCFNS